MWEINTLDSEAYNATCVKEDVIEDLQHKGLKITVTVNTLKRKNRER